MIFGYHLAKLRKELMRMVKKTALLREIKDLFEWVNSRYADENDNMTNKDVQELRLRIRSLQNIIK